MLVSAAVLPHPPLLIPDVASGAAPELDGLRAACRTALGDLRDSSPELLVVVGVGPHEREFGPGCYGSMSSFGVTERVVPPPSGVSTSPETSAEELPLSLTIAAWLLVNARWTGSVLFYAVPRSLTSPDAQIVGRRLSSRSARVAMLVMGDGSAAMSEKAPAHLVPGAVEWQAQVATAMGTADTQQILRWQSTEAERFVAAGLAPWQVLAGAAEGTEWSARLLADTAPYGVAYLVTSWRRVEM